MGTPDASLPQHDASAGAAPDAPLVAAGASDMDSPPRLEPAPTASVPQRGRRPIPASALVLLGINLALLGVCSALSASMLLSPPLARSPQPHATATDATTQTAGTTASPINSATVGTTIGASATATQGATGQPPATATATPVPPPPTATSMPPTVAPPTATATPIPTTQGAH